MKRVVLEESQFIRLAAHCRLHIQIIVLIGAARGRCIHKPFAVDGNVRPRAVKRLLGQHCLRLRDAVLDSRNPQHIARPQRYIAIGHEQLIGECVEHLELNTLVRVICGVNEPASIGREVG